MKFHLGIFDGVQGLIPLIWLGLFSHTPKSPAESTHLEKMMCCFGQKYKSRSTENSLPSAFACWEPGQKTHIKCSLGTFLWSNFMVVNLCITAQRMTQHNREDKHANRLLLWISGSKKRWDFWIAHSAQSPSTAGKFSDAFAWENNKYCFYNMPPSLSLQLGFLHLPDACA